MLAARESPLLAHSRSHATSTYEAGIAALKPHLHSLVVPLLNALGFAKSTPRAPSTINLFGSYDANVLGGVFLGAGMTLSGACPGTVLPQVATGVPSGYFTLLGTLLGGTLWSGFGSKIKSSRSSGKTGASGNGPPTMQSTFNLSLSQTLVAFETACLLLVLLFTIYGSRSISAPISPLVGGLLIGMAQASSLIITGNTLGTSSAYEEIGQWVWHGWRALTEPPKASRYPSTKAITFLLGILGGSWVFTQLAPLHLLPGKALESGPNVGKLSAIAGGCIMILGARLAGGCTSGHGISGMATMGLASFVTVGAMFAGGLGTAAVLG